MLLPKRVKYRRVQRGRMTGKVCIVTGAAQGFGLGIAEELAAELGGEVSSSRIGELIMDKLKEIDEVAYVRFASVYKEFDSAESFREELAKLGE